ncbi:hypothetical protein KFE25_007628 [Diacronema lutheri]|uniref:Uncharacterized protein n=1 Tax=Diacronema lutheri TaxID=2081491 RepID=A0A8J5XW95_DIALT|nr:hypothetical protein KFE25_007628 [Diacronema lutheri]
MRWRAFAASSTPPSKRYAATAVAIDQRVLLYGGTQGGTVVDELWVLEIALGGARGVWMRPDVGGGAPPGRSGHTACLLHAGRKQPSLCAIFAGEGLHGELADLALLRLHAPAADGRGDAADAAIFRATTRAEVDERTEAVTLTTLALAQPLGPPLSLEWVLHATPPPPPPARARNDGDDDGGGVGDGGDTDGAGSAAAWPAPRVAHAAATIFDDSLLVFGGSAAGGFEAFNDLWQCKIKDSAGTASIVWRRPSCAGSAPAPSAGHSLSAIGVRALLVGGSFVDAAYVLDCATWAWARCALGGDEGGAPSRAFYAAVPAGRAVLLFGGVDASTDEEVSAVVGVRLDADLLLDAHAERGAGDVAVSATPCSIQRDAGVKQPAARSHVCAARVGDAVLLFGGRGGGSSSHLGGESACCVEGEDDARRRAQDEEELAEEVGAVLRASKAEARAEDKRAQRAQAALTAAEQREAAARQAEADRLSRAAADRALRERGEAAAAAIREEQRRKAQEEREAREALKASRTGGGFRLEPRAK